MFYDTIHSMMVKQNLTEYVTSIINQMKKNPQFLPQPRIVQVVNYDEVTDGITNFQCVLKNAPKRGSFLRLVSWELDLTNYQLIIHKHQYLGGSGFSARTGKPWDTQKLKYINNSKIITSDFVVLHTPQPRIQPVKLVDFQELAKIEKQCRIREKIKVPVK